MSVSAILLMLTYHLVFRAVASLAAKQIYYFLYYCHEKGREHVVHCHSQSYLCKIQQKKD